MRTVGRTAGEAVAEAFMTQLLVVTVDNRTREVMVKLANEDFG
jgi:hypothetical protein